MKNRVILLLLISIFSLNYCSQRPILENDLILEKGLDTIIIKFNEPRKVIDITVGQGNAFFITCEYDRKVQVESIEIISFYGPLEYYSNKKYSYSLHTTSGTYYGGFRLVDKINTAVIKRVDFKDPNIEIMIDNDIEK